MVKLTIINCYFSLSVLIYYNNNFFMGFKKTLLLDLRIKNCYKTLIFQCSHLFDSKANYYKYIYSFVTSYKWRYFNLKWLKNIFFGIIATNLILIFIPWLIVSLISQYPQMISAILMPWSFSLLLHITSITAYIYF